MGLIILQVKLSMLTVVIQQNSQERIMRALVYNGPETIVFKNVPEPQINKGDALVSIKAVGLCGSDMHAYLGHDERRPAPLILGHEASGVVVGGKKDGKNVVINPLVSCGVCGACLSGRANLCNEREIISMPPRQGAFAEQIAVPEKNLIEIPKKLDLKVAALAEPLATAWHAVALSGQHSARPLAEATALVIGSGAVGLGSALVLKNFGCSRIIIAETNPLRRQTAEHAGFNTVVDPNHKHALAEGFANIVIDAVGNKGTRLASIRSACPGGVIVHIGLGDGLDGFDARRLTLQEILLVGSYTYTMVDFKSTVKAMADGRLGALDWTERRPLEDGPKAFKEMLAGETAAAKIVFLNDR